MANMDELRHQHSLMLRRQYSHSTFCTLIQSQKCTRLATMPRNQRWFLVPGRWSILLQELLRPARKRNRIIFEQQLKQILQEALFIWWNRPWFACQCNDTGRLFSIHKFVNRRFWWLPSAIRLWEVNMHIYTFGWCTYVFVYNGLLHQDHG